MDPQAQFCPNPLCPARGQTAQGHIKVHSYAERRYRCTTCKKTFAASTGTPFYRLHKEPALFVWVVTLLAYGCPTQAIVAAFGLDERTVGAWQDKAGGHAQGVHHHFLSTSPVDLQHVQADEIYGKTVGGRCWLAMALAVPSRLWLGGVVSPIRDLQLIQRLVALVRLAWMPGRALLICVDGLASYVTAFWQAFRAKAYTGRRGRPPYRLPAGVLLGQVIKKHSGRRLVEVVRRVVWGSLGRIGRVLQRTKSGHQINTSYIERLNATFRSRLASLVRRGRGLAHKVETLELGMYLVGCIYNFCTEHRSLRMAVAAGKTKWQERTPAMAASWTDHVWSVQELLSFKPPSLIHG
jgi:transposase-like protein